MLNFDLHLIWISPPVSSHILALAVCFLLLLAKRFLSHLLLSFSLASALCCVVLVCLPAFSASILGCLGNPPCDRNAHASKCFVISAAAWEPPCDGKLCFTTLCPGTRLAIASCASSSYPGHPPCDYMLFIISALSQANNLNHFPGTPLAVASCALSSKPWGTPLAITCFCTSCELLPGNPPLGPRP